MISINNQYNFFPIDTQYSILSFSTKIKQVLSSLKKEIESIISSISKKITPHLISKLKENLDIFEKVLREATYLNEEVYDFSSIKNMYIYIIERKQYDLSND